MKAIRVPRRRLLWLLVTLGVLSIGYFLIALHALERLDAVSPNSAIAEPTLDVVILLQPSPVDSANQVARLASIEEYSWGQWLSESMELYAGIPEGTFLSKPQFRRIKPVALSPLTPEIRAANKQGGGTTQAAYCYMVEQFLAILVETKRPFNWFMFANDHSFIVPSNLKCFLDEVSQSTSFSNELPLYSGNLLQRGMYRNVPLKFASGGAGVVMSATSLKLILFSWVLLGSSVIDKLQIRLERGCPESVLGEEVELVDVVGRGGKDVQCAILQTMRWRHRDGHRSQITIRISPKVQLFVNKGLDASSTMLIQYQTTADVTRGHVPVVKPIPLDELAKCDPSRTAWDRMNPGLVVAYCLQHVFSAQLVPTTEGEGERFNVFGALRTLSGDVDSWYLECKQNLPVGSLERKGKAGAPAKPLAVAPHLVTFHYVSQAESVLLYQYLSGQLPLSSAEDVASRWPATDKAAGHYSRIIRQNSQDAAQLFAFLKSTVVCSGK